MATWQGLREFIHGSFPVHGDENDLISLVFDLEGRTQLVFISPVDVPIGEGQWAQVQSPCASLSSGVDLPALLARASGFPVGGLALQGDVVMLRHAVRLADLDAEEFTVPLKTLTYFADILEQEFGDGTDRF